MCRTHLSLALAAASLMTASLWAQARVGGTAGQGGVGSAPAVARGSSARGIGSGIQMVAPGRSQSGVSIAGRPDTPASASRAAAAVRPGASTFGPAAGIATQPHSQSIPPLGPSIPPLEQGPAGERTAAARRESVIFDFNRTQGRFLRRGGFFPSLPVVVVPYAFGGYEYAAGDPNVIVVERNTQTASSAEHVVTVPPQPSAPAKPAPEPKVIEVQPGQPEGTAEAPAGGVQVFRGGSPQRLEEKTAIYLVALKSGVIYTSREHWLEGETLRYITARGERRTAQISEVDLDLTRQLNAERNMPFVLEVRPASEPGR